MDLRRYCADRRARGSRYSLLLVGIVIPLRVIEWASVEPGLIGIVCGLIGIVYGLIGIVYSLIGIVYSLIGIVYGHYIALYKLYPFYLIEKLSSYLWEN